MLKKTQAQVFYWEFFEMHFQRCVKSVQIWSFFWSVFSHIRTEYEKIRNRKNSVFGHFSHSADSPPSGSIQIRKRVCNIIYSFTKVNKSKQKGSRGRCLLHMPNVFVQHDKSDLMILLTNFIPIQSQQIDISTTRVLLYIFSVCLCVSFYFYQLFLEKLIIKTGYRIIPFFRLVYR